MLWRLATALGVFIVVALVCVLVGNLLVLFGQTATNIVGTFLKDQSILIGLVAGIAQFIWGSPYTPRGPVV